MLSIRSKSEVELHSAFPSMKCSGVPECYSQRVTELPKKRTCSPKAALMSVTTFLKICGRFHQSGSHVLLCIYL